MLNATDLRAAISINGGTPVGYDVMSLLRQLVTVYGGTPTQYSHVGLLRQAITALGGTPTQWSIRELLRQLLAALGVVTTSMDGKVLSRLVATTAATPAVPALVDYFATDGGTFPQYGATQSGLYDATANKTFLAWERWDGFQRVCQVDTYDHTTSAWLASSKAGEGVLRNDDHGVPAIAQGPNGHLFTFFGAHPNSNGQIRIRSSVAARTTASGWVDLAGLGSTLTYPRPVFVGSTLFFFARAEVSANTKMTLVLYTATGVTGNTATFGAEKTLVDWGTDSRFYVSTPIVGPDGYIWIIGTRANFGDNYRRDFYLYRYNPANGTIENVDGSVSVVSASQPIDLTTSNASFRIVTSNPAGYGGGGVCCFDAAGNFHFTYGDGLTDTTVLGYHIVRPAAGGAFSAPVMVYNPGNRYNSSALRPAADGGIDFLAEVNLDGGRGAVDMTLFHRTTGGTWTSSVVMSRGDYPLVSPNFILNGRDDLAWMFVEGTGGGSTSNSSSSLDTDAGNCRVFAWGSGGFKQRAPDTAVTLSRVAIKAGLATGDIVAYIGSRRPRETLTINDPSGKFAISGRNLVTTGALTPGSYPITITSAFRGIGVATPFTLTVAAAVDTTDLALAVYNFAEGSGQAILDTAGHGLSGFLGTSAGDSTFDMVRTSAGLENNTAGAMGVTVGWAPILNQKNIHIFVPMRLLTTNSGGNIFSMRNGLTDQGSWAFSVSNGRLSYGAWNVNRSPISVFSSAVLTVGTWALIELQVVGTSYVLRSDGVDVLAGTLSTDIQANNSAPLTLGVQLGTTGTFSNQFRGTMGCIHIFPRALSSGEATAERTLIKSLMAARGVTLP